MPGLPEQLDKTRGFNEIFLLVKKAVYNSLGRRRVGLMLGLSDLPSNVAAYYTPGVIVLNKKVLDKLRREVKDQRLFNSYLFHILLHEYLHSLGYDEGYAGELCYMVCRENLGDEHPATMMARYGISTVIPSLKEVEECLEDMAEPTPGKVELVKNFDSENVTYLA
ncbi:hypothetical protein J7L70_02555 [Candidatus Bathyarchaeota archaeon]|nr:hypothetical protein [Candidatus Bathyarchaeota archaeon]